MCASSSVQHEVVSEPKWKQTSTVVPSLSIKGLPKEDANYDFQRILYVSELGPLSEE